MITRKLEWLQSPVTIVMGMVFGVVLGVFAPGAAELVAGFGDLFLSFLTMCAIPIMVGALVTSLSSLLNREGPNVALTRLVTVLLLGMLAVGIISVVSGILAKPGAGIDLNERRVFGEALVEHTFQRVNQTSAQAQDGAGFLQSILPANPFVAFVEGNTLQILFITVLFGILLGLLPQSTGEPVTALADVVFRVFQDAISRSLYFLPLGLMGIMAKITISTGGDLLGATVRLIVFVHVVCVVVMVAASGAVALMLKVPVKEQFVKLRKPLMVAFGTRDSIAAMPTLMTTLTEQFGLGAPVVKLVVPLGILLCRYSLIVFYVISLIFAAQLYGIALQPLDYVIILVGSVVATLTTVGTPALVALGATALVAQPLGLPISAVLLIMTGILPVLDPIITMMNLHVIASLTMIATEKHRAPVPASRAVEERARTAGAVVLCLLLLPFLLGGVAQAQPMEAPSVVEDGVEARSLAPGLVRIIEKGQVVVAVLDAERYPFFYRDEHGEWQGVDTDLARDIADALGVELVFDRVAASYDAVVDRVDQGFADIAISKLSTTLHRSKSVLFTDSYVPLRQGLVANRVLLAAARSDYSSPARIVNEVGGTLGVLADSSYVEFGAQRFKNAKIVPFPTLEDMFEAVHAGEVMAGLHDEHQIKQHALAHPAWLVEVEVQLFEDSQDLIAMAVSWRDPYLHQWLNTFLKVNEIQWTIDQLLEFYPSPW